MVESIEENNQRTKMATEDDILTAVRRGIDSRMRLVIAFPKDDAEHIRNLIATLIFKGNLKVHRRQLRVA